MVALFNAMTSEGWAAIMYTGTDATDINMNPIVYH